jgi:hypothetical protein
MFDIFIEENLLEFVKYLVLKMQLEIPFDRNVW